jgi:hypothetical protein
MHDLCPGQGLRKGGKNAVVQDINIPALAACVGHALTTMVSSSAPFSTESLPWDDHQPHMFDK